VAKVPQPQDRKLGLSAGADGDAGSADQSLDAHSFDTTADEFVGGEEVYF